MNNFNPPKDTQKGRENNSETCAMTIWNIPRESKKKFKIKCLEKNITMREAFLQFLEDFTQDV